MVDTSSPPLSTGPQVSGWPEDLLKILEYDMDLLNFAKLCIAQHVSRQRLYSSCLLRMQPDTHPALPNVGNTGSASVSSPVFYHQCLIQLISQSCICPCLSNTHFHCIDNLKHFFWWKTKQISLSYAAVTWSAGPSAFSQHASTGCFSIQTMFTSPFSLVPLKSS